MPNIPHSGTLKTQITAPTLQIANTPAVAVYDAGARSVLLAIKDLLERMLNNG